MRDVPREALLTPWTLFQSQESPCSALAAQFADQPLDGDADGNLGWRVRWTPLFADSLGRGPLEGPAISLKRPRVGQEFEENRREWEMLRLQLHLTVGPPQVVAVGASLKTDPIIVTRLSPCLVQDIPIWIKNDGYSNVEVAVDASVRALEVMWKGPGQSDNKGGRDSVSDRGYSGEESRGTAWLIRVEEDELNELQELSDSVAKHRKRSCTPRRLNEGPFIDCSKNTARGSILHKVCVPGFQFRASPVWIFLHLSLKRSTSRFES